MICNFVSLLYFCPISCTCCISCLTLSKVWVAQPVLSISWTGMEIFSPLFHKECMEEWRKWIVSLKLYCHKIGINNLICPLLQLCWSFSIVDRMEFVLWPNCSLLPSKMHRHPSWWQQQILLKRSHPPPPSEIVKNDPIIIVSQTWAKYWQLLF